jgi:hypothetical protein
MQLAERTSDDVAREMRVREDLESCGCEHEGKEDQTADPDHERENHQEAEEGHDGRIIDKK